MLKSTNCDLTDIEDIILKDDITPAERYNNKKNVTFRAKKQVIQDNIEISDRHKILDNNIIPASYKIYIKTWGCSHNNSDSEYMAGQLSAYGYQLTDKKETADLWLLNSCTVKNPSEDTFRNEIELGIKCGKHVVLAGCVPQGAPKSGYLKGLSIIGVQQIDRVVEVVEETLKGHHVRLLSNKKVNGRRIAGAKLSLPKIRKNPLIEIIPINTGCLNQCTYCKTKHARGDLVSYQPEEIIARALDAFSEGCCEIWLTSEDTGAYGRDIGISLPELLWQLVPVIPDHGMLRIGMTNPPYILEHLEEIAKILKHPRVYSFLHVPVQSGSDSVLSDMKREYCREDFEHVVDFLRTNIPGITIATDIICGFPTESDNDFEETLNLCEKYKFPSLFINQFFPRPGTPAARMSRIPANLVKNRTKRLTELFNSYQSYSGREGQTYKVLVTELSHDKRYYVAHNKYYEQILLPMNENILGKIVDVRIISVSKFSMNAELLNVDMTLLNSTKCNNTIKHKTIIHNLGSLSQKSLRLLLTVGFVTFAVHWLWRHSILFL